MKDAGEVALRARAHIGGHFDDRRVGAGQKLRLRGRGLPGNPAGDQFVLLKVVLPPADTPKARELYEQMKREIPFDARANA